MTHNTPPPVIDVYRRLTYLHQCCEEAGSCFTCKIGEYDCPYKQEKGPWDDYFAPDQWNYDTRVEIARRLLHEEIK